jgi:hypothetical protein
MSDREEFLQIITEHPEMIPFLTDVLETFLSLADQTTEALTRVFEEKRIQYGF